MKANRALLVIGGIVTVGFLTRLLGGGWDLTAVEPPWGARPSIYEHIESHIAAGKDGLSEGGDQLPDEAELFEEGALRWVSGGMDGAFGHHGAGGNEQDSAEQVFGLLKAVLESSTNDRVSQLYHAFARGSSLDYVDPLLERIINDSRLEVDRLHELAVWLATRAADREPVKVALALLGVFQGYDDREIILTLARHEEFTLYASVAITNTEENPERTLWQVARQVDGWGRIQAVERLAETTDPEIRGWLLRQGYKNSILYEYLAHTCAMAGDLHGALAAEQIDEALLLGAGEIIQTLIAGQGGPAEGIDDYEHGASVTQRYLYHLDGRANRLEQFLVLKSVEQYLAASEEDWDERAKRGWTPEARASMEAAVETFVSNEKWRPMAQADLRSDHWRTFGSAADAASHLGIDTWDEYYSRTKNGQDYWFQLMQTRDRARIEKVVALAESQLPLSEIATGPSDEMGLGPEFEHHGALDSILQELANFPVLGWALIKTGLRSPVVRNRNMAIRALAGWDRGQWPEGAAELVENCRAEEPEEDVKESFAKLLAGEPLDF